MPRPKNTQVSITYADLNPLGDRKITIFTAKNYNELVNKLVNKLNLDEPNKQYIDENPNYGRKRLAENLSNAKWVTIDPYVEEIGEGSRVLLLANSLEELEEEYKDSIMSI